MDEWLDEVIFYPEFEEALIGIVDCCGQENVAVYSIEHCYESLMKSENWTYEEAMEFFDYNYRGFFFGKNHPIFVQTEFFELKTIIEQPLVD